MDNKLNIALIQTDIVWESISENLKLFTEKISKIDSSVQLIILPEMFATGFSMNVSYLKQNMDGEIVLWMIEMATKHNVAIYGSVIIEEDNNIYNRAIFVFPSGQIEYYDKKHLFTLAGEEKVFSSGNTRKAVSYLGWKIMLQVCYDLRFPVWSRNNLDYDLLIYIASWPEKRRYAWQTLLKARAIENMSYTIGVNRVGIDGNDFKYSGDSVVLTPLGEELTTNTENIESVLYTSIDRNKISEIRTRFSFLNDGDTFEISSKTP